MATTKKTNETVSQSGCHFVSMMWMLGSWWWFQNNIEQ